MAKMKGVVIVNTERCKGCNLKTPATDVLRAPSYVRTPV